MRKNIARVLLLVFVALYVFNVSSVFAIQYTEINIEGTIRGSYNVRSGPGTTYPNPTGKLTTIGSKHNITRYAKTDDKSTGCETGIWFYTSSLSGWVCSVGFSLASDSSKAISGEEMAKLDDKGFEAYLLSEGFPSSYWPGLKTMHAKYPNWVFKAVNTYKIWDSILKDESEPGMSTFQITAAREAQGYEGYLNTDTYYIWESDMFYGYDGNFFLANRSAVAHYLDPRNFLTESTVFMFESQLYRESSKNSQLITNILGTSAYSETLINIGRDLNISPVALASRIKQEGTIGGRVTAGNIDIKCNGTLYNVNGSTAYKAPLYNFYNIGAYSATDNADLNGLCYAAQTDESTLRPWNTVDKAIKGGAMFIGAGYIFAGQYTTYFQKFNVSPITTSALGHQYMTNIEDPKSSSSIVYGKYAALNALNSDFVFHIPYYLDMPTEAVKAPALGNPNNWLSKIAINGTTISGFKGGTTSYTVTIPSNTTSIKVDATTVAKASNLSINGGGKVVKNGSANINTPNNDTNFNIVVTAANGSTKTYTITLKKDIGNNDNNSGNDNSGDSNNGDGTVNPPAPSEPSVNKLISDSNLIYSGNYLNGINIGTTVDQLTKKLIANNSKAVVSYKNASKQAKTSGTLVTGDTITITSNNETKNIEVIIYGDCSGDGKISISDLLAVQKHILGDASLSGVYFKAADADKDGKVSIKDLLLVQKNILGDSNIKQL